MNDNVSLISTEIDVLSCDYPESNPYPIFREYPINQEVSAEASLHKNPEDMKLLGYENARRYLPYKKQDIYNRNRSVKKEPVLILENQYLKATFLPNYGGRLYSLYSKEMEKELLFCNPVIQPANLAILDAWIAGGIEWNLGQLGHTFTTCAPLFSSSMKDKEGNTFLRMYEYERCRGLFWSLDFHLLPDSRQLEMYVRIVNDKETQSLVYWWTNTAVPETKDTRIFAGASRVIYMNMEKLSYGTCRMPELPFMPGIDVSYPSRFENSEEFFFQEQDDPCAPWEAAVYPDRVFYERSSGRLAYRKMFCWGTKPGSRHWKDYLSVPGQGDYVEIQAGLARTQRHGLIMDGGETWDFVQCFGGFAKGEKEYLEQDWYLERDALERRIDKELPAGHMEELRLKWAEYAQEEPSELLSMGSGFGALEMLLRAQQGSKKIPAGFYFPEESIGKEESMWKCLLETGRLGTEGELDIPASYMIQEEWEQLLKDCVAVEAEDSFLPSLLLGICYLDKAMFEKAEEMFLLSTEKKETALACRCMAELCLRTGKEDAVCTYYEKAFSLGNEQEQKIIGREYLKYLYGRKDWSGLNALYRSWPERVREDETAYLYAARAALELDDLETVEAAFHREYVYIRESATDLSDLWFRYQMKKELKEHGTVMTKVEAEQRYPVPYELDFRMV